jgi:hypothetical protein
MNFLLHASPRHKHWGVYPILRSTHPQNCRQKCLSPAAALAMVVNERDTTYCQAQYAMMLFEKVVVLQKKCDKCWLMGWRVRCPVHPPAHCVLHCQQASASWACLFLSHYGALFQVHVRKVVSDADIDADIPSVQREKFNCKKKNGMACPHTPH